MLSERPKRFLLRKVFGQMSAVETRDMSSVGTRHMSSVETGHMSFVETGHMSYVETGHMSAVEIRQKKSAAETGQMPWSDHNHHLYWPIPV